jgi:large subunit ribosomal protein L6
MSRIGKKPVPIPQGVKVQIAERTVVVEGPKGKLQFVMPPDIDAQYDAQQQAVLVSRRDDGRFSRSVHGMTRAMIQNMVVGVTTGYEQRLEIIGVGYLAAVQGNVLQLRVGYANELQVPIPEGVKVSVPDQQHIVLQSSDKQLLGHFAANVRALRLPEPYKGKGIRYLGESVRRKQGKAMVK